MKQWINKDHPRIKNRTSEEQTQRDEIARTLNEKRSGSEESKRIESKEKMKTPELETENFKIKKDLSIWEKILEWWEEHEQEVNINNEYKEIKVLHRNLPTNLGTNAIEYLDDWITPKCLVWENLVWLDIAITMQFLWFKLPTQEEIKSIIWEDPNAFVNKYFKKWKNYILPGSRPYSDTKRLYWVNKEAVFWLKNGHSFSIQQGKDGNRNIEFYNKPPYNADDLHSLRLLK
jgi:hypothetical protein